MASLREIRKRIRSVKNTQKITRAMKLVSAAKLRRAQQAIVSARPYAKSLHQAITRVAERAGVDAGSDAPHALLRRPAHTKRVMIVVLTSDRGMCGAFNSNVLKNAERFIANNKATYELMELGTVGRRGRDYYRKRKANIRREYTNILDGVTFAKAKAIADELAQEFVAQDLDAVYFIYNEFKSAISQNVVVEQLLPIAASTEAVASDTDFIYEPSSEAVLNELLPRYLATQIYRALLESQASEHGARMSAMENATKNASEMIGNLTLVYNRARQAAITKELLEIIAGAEAQKG